MQPPNRYPYQQPGNFGPPPKPPGRIQRFAFWYRVQTRPVQIIVGIAMIACIIFVGSAAVAGAVQGAQQALLPIPTTVPVPTTAPTQVSQPTSAPTAEPTQEPTQPTSLAESLTFHGDISGMLTTGIDPHPITSNNPIPSYVQQSDGTFFDPAPTLTQCSDFDTNAAGRDSVAVIIGNVRAMRYAVTIEINEDNPAYAKPGTELHPGDTNSGGSVEVYEMGGKNRRWQQVYGPDSQDTTIVLHPGRVSGTVDAWMATTDMPQKSADSTLHLQGNWRCG